MCCNDKIAWRDYCLRISAAIHCNLLRSKNWRISKALWRWRLYKNPNELAAALISEDFKEESNYQIELDRVREFGLIVKSAFKVDR